MKTEQELRDIMQKIIEILRENNVDEEVVKKIESFIP